MDFNYLWTSFDGRINRQPFWVGAIVLAVAAIVVSLILGLILPQWLVQVVVTLAVIYPWLALTVKRLHDNGDPAMPLAAIFIAPSIVAALLRLLGLTHSSTMMGDVVLIYPNAFGWIINLIVLGIGLYALYYLGIRKGQEGPNQYGPDPLGAR